jgi:hypothetical protein
MTTKAITQKTAVQTSSPVFTVMFGSVIIAVALRIREDGYVGNMKATDHLVDPSHRLNSNVIINFGGLPCEDIKTNLTDRG